jgi:archaellum biogenesis ATPase FlaH
MEETWKLTEKLDNAKIPELLKENKTSFFAMSRFKFIERHHGLRPGLMHVLLGTTGSGKTTLSRSILSDMAKQDRVLFYSTEETQDQFMIQSSNQKKMNIENISFLHEDQILKLVNGKHDIDGFVQSLAWAMEERKCKALFFDNITTSIFYDENEKAVEMVVKLRELMNKAKKPFFVVAHTSANVSNGQWFESNAVRGRRVITTKAEYVYCLFRCRVNLGGVEHQTSIVHVDKSRLHAGIKEFYRLDYDSSLNDYVSDNKVNYDSVLKLLKGK